MDEAAVEQLKESSAQAWGLGDYAKIAQLILPVSRALVDERQVARVPPRRERERHRPGERRAEADDGRADVDPDRDVVGGDRGEQFVAVGVVDVHDRGGADVGAGGDQVEGTRDGPVLQGQEAQAGRGAAGGSHRDNPP